MNGPLVFTLPLALVCGFALAADQPAKQTSQPGKQFQVTAEFSAAENTIEELTGTPVADADSQARLQQARAVFQAAVKQFPDSTLALNFLARSYCFPGQDMAVGIATFEKSLALDPDQPDPVGIDIQYSAKAWANVSGPGHYNVRHSNAQYDWQMFYFITAGNIAGYPAPVGRPAIHAPRRPADTPALPRLALPRPRRRCAPAPATSAVPGPGGRASRAMPPTAPSAATAVRASRSRWSTRASSERVRSLSLLTPARKRAYRVSGPSPSNQAPIAASSPKASGRTPTAEPSRKTTRS